MQERILIVDDEECIRTTFAEILSAADYRVETADGLADCLAKLHLEDYDLLFLDINLGGDNGLTAIEAIKELQPDCRIVIITGQPQLRSLVAAKQYGAVDYLTKPVRQASLLYNVKKVLGQRTAGPYRVNGDTRFSDSH